MRELGAHRLDVALDFVLHASEHATSDRRFSTVPHAWHFALGFYKRQSSRELMQGSQSHLHAWSDVSSPVIAASINDFVGDASACVDDEKVFAWPQRTGSDDGSQAVAAQRFRCAITTCNGDRRVVGETKERKRQSRESFLLAFSKVTNRTNDASLEPMFLHESVKSGEHSVLCAHFIDRLIASESNHLGDGVPYVYYQLHGCKGTNK